MKLHVPFTSITFRIFVLILVSQAVLYGTFAFLILDSSNEAIKASEAATFRLIGDTVHWSMDDEIASASLSILSVVQDERVGEFFSTGDRAGLARYLKPLYEKMRDRVTRFHFHLPDGTSFLRMHDLDSFGDPIASMRPMISTALDLRATVSGIESGKNGLGLRVVTPIFRESEFLGVVEFGMDFGESFVTRLKEKHAGDYFIFLFSYDKPLRFVAGTRSTELCPLAVQSLDDLMKGKAVWSLDCSEARAVGLYPFRDFSGNPIGFVKAELLHIPLAEAMQGVRTRLVVLGIALVALLGITVAFSIRALLRPLHHVVDQTRMISERILAGDVGYRGDVSGTVSDFRAIIAAVNDIISALREREIVLQAIVQGIPGVVYYINAAFQVKWANNRALAMVSNLVGSDIRNAESGFFDLESKMLAETFATGEVQTIEACYVDESGVSRSCWEHVAVPVRAETGLVDHVIRISTDVSARRTAESDLRQLNEELELRVESEVKRRQEGELIADQQSRLAAIGELATGMAHEITQPLNAISFTFENLRSRFELQDIDTAYLTAKSSAVASDIERIRRVIDHVRLFARSVPDEYRIAFYANSCIDNTLALIGVQLATHGIDSVVEVPSQSRPLLGNPYKYEQVLLNLLSNARDAIEERYLAEIAADKADPLPGLIRISIHDEGPDVVLEIQDNGSGIEETVRSKIFNPFFSTKAPGKGTGLGLSISFGIISDMSGTIELVKAPAGGTIARVSVPAATNETRVEHD